MSRVFFHCFFSVGGKLARAEEEEELEKEGERLENIFFGRAEGVGLIGWSFVVI